LARAALPPSCHHSPAIQLIIEKIKGRMVSKCRRHIFVCYNVLPRNIISWIKIHQLILLKEMAENVNTSNTCKKKIFSSALVV